MSKIVHLIFNEVSLTVVGAIPELCDLLTYVHRSIDMETRGRPITSAPRAMFEIGEPYKGRPVLHTYQGLMGYVVDCLQHHGCEIKYRDNRNVFPAPLFHKMFGFRFSQSSMLTQALAQQKSGLIGAPTRYGKSTLLLNTIRAFPGIKTVVTAPGIDLLEQLQEELTVALPHREVKGIYTGSHGKQQSDHGVTVVSMDSLEKCDFLGTKLVLVDEPHSIVTESRACFLHGFLNARRIGFGATLSGRFDKADIMIQALIGPALANKTYVEARDEGAVCPIEVCVLNLPMQAFSGVDRDAAYRAAVVHNPQFKEAVADICLRALPSDWQTLVFISTEVQAKGLQEVMPHGTIAMGKLLNKAERKAMTARVKNNEIKRCICSNIYSTGTTFHEARAMVNCGLGGGSISCVQKPGRLAEIRPGKKCGVVVDFAWKVKASGFPSLLDPDDALRMVPGNEAWKDVVRDSQSRLKVYREKGYNITYHDSVDSIRDCVARFV